MKGITLLFKILKYDKIFIRVNTFIISKLIFISFLEELITDELRIKNDTFLYADRINLGGELLIFSTISFDREGSC